MCTSVSNTHVRVSVLRIKFKSKETEDFLAWAVKVPVEVTVNVAFSCLLFASFVLLQLLQQTCPGLLAASMKQISIGLLLIRKYNIFC